MKLRGKALSIWALTLAVIALVMSGPWLLWCWLAPALDAASPGNFENPETAVYHYNAWANPFNYLLVALTALPIVLATMASNRNAVEQDRAIATRAGAARVVSAVAVIIVIFGICLFTSELNSVHAAR